MGRFTVIPENTFSEIQTEAGVLLKRFDPANPTAPDDEDIICATTGGITVSCTPTFSDLGEDVDNCPNNMMELKHLDSWDCKMSTTALGTSPESIRLELGAADINAETGAITPRAALLQTDFADVWWVGDRADGGLVAVQIHNALATSGFSLKTSKKGKGNISLELTGHVSIKAQDIVPMTFYSMGATTPSYIYTAVTPVGTENPANAHWYEKEDDVYFPTTDTEVDGEKTYYVRSATPTPTEP